MIGDALVFDGVAHPFNFEADNAYGPAGQMFSNMFYLNRACEIQESVLSMGVPLKPVDETVARRVTEQYDQMAFDDGDLLLEWDAQMRLADRLDPGFRD